MPQRKPSLFVFEVNQAFAGITRVELQSGRLMLSRLSRDSTKDAAAQRHVQESYGGWPTFLRATDFLDLWNWKPRYDPSELGYVVKDGQSWEVTLVYKDRSVRSCGVNAYPAFESPAHASLEEERFGLLAYCVGELIAHDWDLTNRPD